MIANIIKVSKKYWRSINNEIVKHSDSPNDTIEIKERNLPITHPAWTPTREPILELHINGKFVVAFNDVAA